MVISENPIDQVTTICINDNWKLALGEGQIKSLKTCTQFNFKSIRVYHGKNM
jgi:hypothetical protein